MRFTTSIRNSRIREKPSVTRQVCLNELRQPRWFDLHVGRRGRVFLGTFDFSHDLSGHLPTSARECDGRFFGGTRRENRDEVLGGCLVADRHEEKGEASEEKHDTVYEAFDEITQHLVGISVRATCEAPQFSATFVRRQEIGVQVAEQNGCFACDGLNFYQARRTLDTHLL